MGLRTIIPNHAGSEFPAEFSGVRLTRDLSYRGTLYPEGTRGVVVHRHNDAAYEVEFTTPKFSVITLKRKDFSVGA